MGLLDHYLRRRYGRQRRFHGYGYPSRGGYGRRPHRRGGTRVHVSGCCLPIPCGTLVLMAGTGAEIARRRMR